MAATTATVVMVTAWVVTVMMVKAVMVTVVMVTVVVEPISRNLRRDMCHCVVNGACVI